MTPQQLKSLKQDVKKLYKVYDNLAKYFDNPITTTISVLLQNLAFDGSDCQTYSHEKEVEKVNNILSLLRELKDYNSFYLTEFAYTEVDMIFTGIFMSEN